MFCERCLLPSALNAVVHLVPKRDFSSLIFSLSPHNSHTTFPVRRVRFICVFVFKTRYGKEQMVGGVGTKPKGSYA